VCAFEPPVEASHLGGEQFVVGGWSVVCHGCFPGGEQLGAGEELADLIEHEGVEFGSPDPGFRAATVRSARPPGVAVGADVVAGRVVAASGSVADELDPAASAA
jgi:hypothetical protein